MIVQVIASCLLVSQAAAGAGAMSAPQFIRRLDALESTLKTAQPGDAGALAAAWSGEAQIQAGPDTYDIDLEWAGGPLRSAATDPTRWPEARAAVEAGLERVRRDVRAALSGQPVADGKARAALDGVLSDRHFMAARRTDWRTAAWQHVSRWARRAWRASLGARVGSRTIGALLARAVAGGAILAFGAWLVVISRRRRLESAVSIGRVGTRGPGGRELALEAAALVREGRIRDAIRVAYRAAVQRLEEEGAWRADPTRTPREYLGLLPQDHRRRTVLTTLTQAFERMWYGSRPASGTDGAEILTCLAELECLPRDHGI